MFQKATPRITLILALAAVLGGTTATAQQGLAIKNAMETIFSPRRAPNEKTMGMVQRSFIDIIETRHTELKVALVIDGTDSMSDQFAGVRAALKNMVADLRRYKGDSVSFQLVIYRDEAAKSGVVQFMLNDFTKDIDLLSRTLSEVKTESGAPYFFEPVDLGVEKALTTLNWGKDTEDKKTARWLILIGDAPPFDEGFQEKETKARRHYDTDVLINLAKSKGVQVNCILCTSREQDKEVYNQVLDRTRSFMGRLSTQTGGSMLDLSYPDIRKVYAEAAKATAVEYQAIQAISQREVLEVRQQAHEEQEPVSLGRRLKVAILPHMPFDKTRFDSSLPAMKVTAELRQKFRMLSQVEVKSSSQVNRQLRRIKSRRLTDSQRLKALAAGLRVDYLVWGGYDEAGGIVTVNTAVYSDAAVAIVGPVRVNTGEGIEAPQLAGRVMQGLAVPGPANASNPMLAALVPIRNNVPFRDAMVTPVSNTEPARSDLLVGMDALEEARGFIKGSQESKPLLDKAAARLTAAVGQQGQSRNPLAHLALANAQYNLAFWYSERGEKKAAENSMKRFSEALKRARRTKRNSKFETIQTEIEADFNLWITRDRAKAIELYEQLTKVKDGSPLYQARRAHWMLSGIQGGDFGLKGKVDAKESRRHMIMILAHWPDSPEAKIIRAELRWSDEKGGSQFNHLAKKHTPLAGAVPPNQNNAPNNNNNKKKN